MASDCPTASCVYNALPSVIGVVLEPREHRRVFLSRRVKKLGWWVVLGQIAFQIGVVPLLGRLSRHRVGEIKEKYGLSEEPIPRAKVHHVPSVNHPEARKILGDLDPDLIVVHGTRIIGTETLASCQCPWVNIHAGITPNYRGSHGGYWALYHSDPDHCGVTLHLVDRGIDTGGVLAQSVITPTGQDNFVTYPWLQLGVGLQMLSLALQRWPEEIGPQGPSCLRHHPTIWQYCEGLTRGVR